MKPNRSIYAVPEAGVIPSFEPTGRLAEQTGAAVMRGLCFAEEDPMTKTQREQAAAQAAADRRRETGRRTRETVEQRRSKRENSSGS